MNASLQGRLGQKAVKAAASTLLPQTWFARSGPRRGKRLSVTFDDGPCRETPAYLELLARFGVRATFFIVGAACAKRRTELREMTAAGHEVALHGYSHRPFTDLDPRTLSAELARTRELVPNQSGRRFIRPPYGDFSPITLLTCAREGYSTVLWSRDSLDWKIRNPDTLIGEFRAKPARAGDILLFHEGQAWTLAALPRILDHLLEAEYELVTVGELLAV